MTDAAERHSLSPLPPAPTRQPSQASLPAVRTETEEQRRDRHAHEGYSTAFELRPRVHALETLVGRPPDPMTKGDRGNGAIGKMFEVEGALVSLTSSVDGLRASVDADVASRKAAAEAAALAAKEKREPISRWAWAVITALSISALLALGGLVSAAILRHWR